MRAKKTWIIVGLGAMIGLSIILGIRQYAGNSNFAQAEKSISEAMRATELNKEKKDRDHGLKRVNTEASYFAFGNIDDLEKDADVIVVGTPILPFEEREHKATYYDDGTIQDFYTLTDFRVEKVIKDTDGAVQNERIQFVEPISIITRKDGEKVIFSIADYQDITEGERYLVFLKDNGLGKYGVTNMNNGTFDLNENAEDSFHALEIEGDPKHEKLKKEALQKYDLD